jgi:hypothetical protein
MGGAVSTLNSLASGLALDEFSRTIARNAATTREQNVKINNGIRMTEELYQHILNGKNAHFDVQILVNESSNYLWPGL